MRFISCLLFCIDHDSITSDAFGLWTDIVDDDFYLGDLIEDRFVSLLESGHRTEKMP